MRDKHEGTEHLTHSPDLCVNARLGTFHLEGGDDMATLGSLENVHTWQLLP